MQGHWKDFLVTDMSAHDRGGNLRHGDGQTNTPAPWQALIDRFSRATCWMWVWAKVTPLPSSPAAA